MHGSVYIQAIGVEKKDLETFFYLLFINCCNFLMETVFCLHRNGTSLLISGPVL